MARGPEHLGGKLGPKLATHVQRAVLASKVASGPHTHKLAMQIQESFFHLTGAELKATLGPLYARLADHELTPEWAARTFDFLGRGHGQLQTLIGSELSAHILSEGIGALITNELEPLIAEIIAANPGMILDAGSAASSYVRGISDFGHAAREAAFNGIDSDRFATLVKLAGHEIDPGSTLEALRRGIIDDTTAVAFLKDAGFRDNAAGLMLGLSRALLPPALLADAVVKGLVDPGEAAATAQKSGVHPDDFDLMVHDSGDALDVSALLEAYRRGIIDDARLTHGVRTGRLRNEWVDVVKALRYMPPSPSEAIGGAVQGHLTEAQAKAKAEDAGLNPAEFDWLFQTHGEPIATGQAIELWRRGEMSEAEVSQVIRESRTKTKYVPALLKLRFRTIPARTVVAIHNRGGFTLAQAAAKLAEDGIRPDDATAMLTEATATKTARHRDLSESLLVELYEAKALDVDHLLAALVALGYDHHEAEQIVTLSDLKVARRRQLAAEAVIRARFVAHHISESEATTALDAAQVAPAERHELLTLWRLERSATTHAPSVAELSAAVKAGVLTADDWGARLVAMGYAETDLAIMAAAHKIGG